MVTVSAIPNTQRVATRPHFTGNTDGNFQAVHHRGRNDYAAMAYQTAGLGQQAKPDAYLQELIAQLVPPSGKILELGCNSGNNLIPLAENPKRYTVYGVDLSKDQLDKLSANRANATLNGTLKTQQWDFAESGTLPWQELKSESQPHGNLDAIYSVHVLSHLAEDHLIETLPKLTRYLKPGGVFIATVLDADLQESHRRLPSSLKQAIERLNAVPWCRFIERQRRLNDLRRFPSQVYGGRILHSRKGVNQAMAGLEERTDLGRLFKRGENPRWNLPESHIRWVVYQKPVNP